MSTRNQNTEDMSLVSQDFFRLAWHESKGYLERKAFLEALTPLAIQMRDWLERSSHWPERHDIISDCTALSSETGCADLKQTARLFLAALGTETSSVANDNRGQPALYIPTRVIEDRYVWGGKLSDKDPDGPLKAITQALKSVTSHPQLNHQPAPTPPAQGAFCYLSHRKDISSKPHLQYS
jgi:hypothetical protein